MQSILLRNLIEFTKPKYDKIRIIITDLKRKCMITVQSHITIVIALIIHEKNGTQRVPEIPTASVFHFFILQG